MASGHDRLVIKSVTESTSNSHVRKVVYLLEAATQNNQGRPLDTFLRAALVAVDTHREEIQFMSHFSLPYISEFIFV